MLATGTLLVLAMRGRRTPQRARKVRRRSESRVAFDTSRQSRRDLLEQPAVAVRIIERGERTVAAVLGIRAMEPNPAKQIRLVGSGIRVGQRRGTLR